MAKLYDISINYIDHTFKAALETSELSSKLFKELMTITGHIGEIVEVEGYFVVRFKGKYWEPYVEAFSVIAKGPFGKIVPLTEADVDFSLLSVELFDILDTDRVTEAQRYQTQTRRDEYEND